MRNPDCEMVTEWWGASRPVLGPDQFATPNLRWVVSAMKNTKNCPRREVHYDSLEQMLGDADRLAAAGARTTGNWSMAQIFEHLATVLDKFVDGYGFTAPLPMRLVAKLFKQRALHHSLPAGYKLPSRAAVLLPAEEVDVASALNHLHSAVGRFRAAAKLHPNPFLGQLTREEATLLNLRHCELHMSFIENPEG